MSYMHKPPNDLGREIIIPFDGSRSHGPSPKDTGGVNPVGWDLISLL